MSKAFTRESDDAAPSREPRRLPSLLPPGAKNLMTPDGAEKLRAELDRLIQLERPRWASQPDPDATRDALAALDERIEYLARSLETAEVVPLPDPPRDQVSFGMTVTVREKDGTLATYRIVGVDETDVDRGWVSWLSPVAKALLRARVGDRVRLKLPAGATELEVVTIR